MLVVTVEACCINTRRRLSRFKRGRCVRFVATRALFATSSLSKLRDTNAI